jgi:hypothetical protein
MEQSRSWECWNGFMVCNLLTPSLTVLPRRAPSAPRHSENISERSIDILKTSALAVFTRLWRVEMHFLISVEMLAE